LISEAKRCISSQVLAPPEFGHLMQITDSFEKLLMLGGIGAGGEGDDRG